jgi:hypothetical protein
MHCVESKKSASNAAVTVEIVTAYLMWGSLRMGVSSLDLGRSSGPFFLADILPYARIAYRFSASS